MSRNILDHRQQPITRLSQRIKQVRASQQRSRTLQLQGNDALSLSILEGYFTIDIPTTITPEVSIVELDTPSSDTIMLANLMYSVFYLESGVYENKDEDGLYPEHLSIECFLARSAANQGDAPMDGDDSFDLFPVVGSNVARITAKLRADESWSLPAGASSSAVIYYQIRATLM